MTGTAMTRRGVGYALVVTGMLGLAGDPVWAQTPTEAPIEQVPTAEAPTALSGPAGVTLSMVAQTPGVPVMLHAIGGTATRPLSAVTLTSQAPTSLVRVALSVTWTPPGEPPRRRLLLVPVALAPGQTVRLDLAETTLAQGLAGRTGAVEVAPAGARASDGTAWAHSPGPVWATGRTDIACGDDAWAPQPAGTDVPDTLTGAIVRCAADGRWLRLDGEIAR